MQNRRQLSLVVITIFGIFGFYDKLFLFAPLSPKEDTAINDLKDVETLQEKNNIFKRQQQHPNISNINNYYQCELETPNPWDPTITKYLKPNIKKCETNFQNLTFLNVNGYISVNYNLAKVNTTCQWQCLIPGNKGADSYSSGPWIDILSEKPTCDVFKVRCLANKEKYYETLHVQIIPKPISPPNNSDQKIFNIHIFVIDSVSRSQGLRFLPKTIDFFQKEMKATHFPYFNKVGYNSYPNGNAFLYGKSVPRDNKNNNIPPIITKVLADNQTFENHYIGKILQQFGFPTLFNEDVHSIFPKASNFSTHTLAPLSQEIVKYKNFKNSHLFDDQCQTTLNFNLKMLSEFITKYSNAPKFSLNWNTFLSHDHLNHLSVADDVMLEFLRINQNELDNSFFILMGDHGPNFGFYRYEEVIGYEDMNPMLYISVPKFLREDEKLSNILVQNSKKLVTHFDLYSTFIDIAISYGAEIPIDTTLHGESLFKPIQDGRDCSKLGVSPMFCNCRYKREMLAINDSLHSKIIDKIFENGNETIYPYRNVCKIPVFDSRFIPIIEQIFMPGTSKSLKVFKVTFETKPDYGRWWTYVHVHHTKNHSITNINNMMQFGIRINPAGWKCLTNILNFCFCIKNSLWYENP